MLRNSSCLHVSMELCITHYSLTFCNVYNININDKCNGTLNNEYVRLKDLTFNLKKYSRCTIIARLLLRKYFDSEDCDPLVMNATRQ